MPAKRDFGQVRMRDVAASAGVSVITVSRALRSPNMVSEETRARITAAIRALGYVPNGVAASLSSRRSNIVAVLVPNIRNALHASMIQGLSETLNAARLQLIVAMVGQSKEQEEEVLATCLQQQPCAVVLYHTRHTEGTVQLLRRARIPVVEVGDLIGGAIEAVVSYSNRAAGKAITRCLVEQGCRDIAMVVPPVSDNARKRYQGHCAALRQLGVAVRPERRFTCAAGYDHGAEIATQIIVAAPTVDAILFSSLPSAVGAWFERERQDGTVARSVIIASFDDPELTGWRLPRLTVVRLPRYEAGQQAGRVIVERLQGGAPALTRHDLGFEIRCL